MITGQPLEVSTEGETGSGLRVADLVEKVLYIVVGVLGIVGNALVIFVIGSAPKIRQKSTNMFLLNQSCVDMAVSLVLVISISSTEDYQLRGAGGEAICRLWLSGWLVWGTFMTSTYNLVALTLERYLGIVHPIWHKNAVNANRVLAAIVCVWLIGPIYSLYQVITAKVIQGQCNILYSWSSKKVQRAFGVATVFMEFIIPLVTMVICYVRMAIALQLRVVPMATTSNTVDTKMMRAKRNVVKTLIIVCICFFLCWVWNQFFFLTFNLGIPVASFTGGFYHFTVMAVYTNCCVNPFIYSFKYTEFKKRLREIFCRARDPDFVTSDMDRTGSTGASNPGQPGSTAHAPSSVGTVGHGSTVAAEMPSAAD